MGTHCCNHDNNPAKTKAYRNVLWAAFVLNLAMCVVEVWFGFNQNSVALKADALDFFGDSATYIITLLVLTKSIQTKAKVGMLKGVSMGLFGAFVLAETVYRFVVEASPSPFIMGYIGVAALVVNLICTALLYTFREGDSNVRSVWLCSRNDSIANIAIIAAAYGVYYFNNNIPDLIVGGIISYLALQSCFSVIKQAKEELKRG